MIFQYYLIISDIFHFGVLNFRLFYGHGTIAYSKNNQSHRIIVIIQLNFHIVLQYIVLKELNNLEKNNLKFTILELMYIKFHNVLKISHIILRNQKILESCCCLLTKLKYAFFL